MSRRWFTNGVTPWGCTDEKLSMKYSMSSCVHSDPRSAMLSSCGQHFVAVWGVSKDDEVGGLRNTNLVGASNSAASCAWYMTVSFSSSHREQGTNRTSSFDSVGTSFLPSFVAIDEELSTTHIDSGRFPWILLSERSWLEKEWNPAGEDIGLLLSRRRLSGWMMIRPFRGRGRCLNFREWDPSCVGDGGAFMTQWISRRFKSNYLSHWMWEGLAAPLSHHLCKVTDEGHDDVGV